MELMKLMEDWNGYSSLSETGRQHTDAQITQCIDLLSNAKGHPSHRHQYLLREALTTSDFPYLFGDVLQRQVLTQYKAVLPVWKQYMKLSTVPRIYPQVGGYRFAITGGDQVLGEVAEKGEYLASDREEARYTLYVKKYGRQFDISWEAMINDDLNALKDTPMRFAKAAARTEHRVAVNLYAGDYSAVSHAANLYSDGVAAEINAVAALLTVANLEAGLEAMAGWVDAGGEPIMNRAKFLVVPPALEMTGLQILNSTSVMWADYTTRAAGPINYPMPIANVVAKMGLTLVVDPYLPIMDTTYGDTAWYLFSDPNDIAAVECAHLTGHESPEICMKASDKVTIGGGAINPMAGDFATDNVFYRVRLVFGGTTLDWRATYAGGLVGI